MKFFLLFLFLFGALPEIQAGNTFGSYYIKRSPKGLLLGDAYVARATDDHLLFYNPSTLARNESMSGSLINFSASANDISDDKDRFDDMPDTPQGVTNQFMDYPVHIDAGTVPGLQIFNVGFSLIYNTEVNAMVSNRASPVLDLNYRYDNGFILGAGFPVAKSGCGKVGLGGAAKYLKRTGIDDRFSLVGTRVLNAIDGDKDSGEALEELGLHTDKTWGFDVGLEYSCLKGPSEFAMGLSFLDVYTKFNVPDDKTLPEQDMTANWGVSYKVDSGIFFIQASADVSPVNRGLPLGQMVHAGIEVGTPIISLLGGYGPGGMSYGAEVNLFLFKLIGGFYHANMGPAKEPIKQSRALVYLSLLDFSFDL